MITEFLTGLVASVVRPIIQEELEKLKGFMLDQYYRKKAFEKYDKEAEELISAAENATTTEQVRAHLKELRRIRAGLEL